MQLDTFLNQNWALQKVLPIWRIMAGVHKRHIFDLDDTIVQYRKRGFAVPRQTFHALRALYYAGHEFAIVSYNPLAHLVVAQTGLSKYISRVVVEEKGERADLVLAACRAMGWRADAGFNYYDDRADNIQNVQERFASLAVCQIISTPEALWTYLKS